MRYSGEDKGFSYKTMHGGPQAAWCCMGLHGAAWGCNYGAPGCMGLHGAAWGCMGLHGAVWGPRLLFINIKPCLVFVILRSSLTWVATPGIVVQLLAYVRLLKAAGNC